MSNPNNNKPNEYFSKLKDTIKNFEYKNQSDKLKEKLSSLKNQSQSSEYWKKLKDYKENFSKQLLEEKEKINKNKFQTNGNNSIFTKIYQKSKGFADHMKDSIKEGKIKDDLQNVSEKLKNYEYSKKFQEVSQKAQEKIKEADIPEKIKIIKEKANQTAEQYHVKEKISDYSEKGKEKAKIFAEKSKENVGKTSSFIKNNWRFFGDKFRNYGRQRVKSIIFFTFAIVFVYGFSTSLPKAYYDYQRYREEKEQREKERNLLLERMKPQEKK